MSGRKREPVAELGAEDYRIVKHTHDVEIAAKLMRAALFAEDGCRDRVWVTCETHATTEECRAAVSTGRPVPVWVRIVPALPNSYAASEGLSYTFNPAEPNSPGAFRAVEFR